MALPEGSPQPSTAVEQEREIDVSLPPEEGDFAGRDRLARNVLAGWAAYFVIGVVGFLGYLGLIYLATTIWNRSKQPETTSNFAGSAIDPATLDRHGRPEGLRGPWACKPDAAGMALVCW